MLLGYPFITFLNSNVIGRVSSLAPKYTSIDVIKRPVVVEVGFGSTEKVGALKTIGTYAVGTASAMASAPAAVQDSCYRVNLNVCPVIAVVLVSSRVVVIANSWTTESTVK